MQTLVTICSRTPGFARFEKSIEENRNFVWEKVFVSPYPGNTKRWEHLPKGLTGQIIFTDTDDVVLQGHVPEMLGIVTAPENVLHKDSFWADKCVGEYEVLLDKPVYNAGIMSMSAEEMYEMADFILKHPGNDQLSYNLWLLGKRHTPNMMIFLPLYNNLDKAKKISGDLADLWIVDGLVPRFVHANGNNKDKL